MAEYISPERYQPPAPRHVVPDLYPVNQAAHIIEVQARMDSERFRRVETYMKMPPRERALFLLKRIELPVHIELVYPKMPPLTWFERVVKKQQPYPQPLRDIEVPECGKGYFLYEKTRGWLLGGIAGNDKPAYFEYHDGAVSNVPKYAPPTTYSELYFTEEGELYKSHGNVETERNCVILQRPTHYGDPAQANRILDGFLHVNDVPNDEMLGRDPIPDPDKP